MDAGRFNRRIMFYNVTNVADGFTAGATISYTSAYNCWADIKIRTGREFWAAQKTNNELDGIITVRHTTALNPDMKIKYDDVYYDILYLIPIERETMYKDLEIHVKAVTT